MSSNRWLIAKREKKRREGEQRLLEKSWKHEKFITQATGSQARARTRKKAWNCFASPTYVESMNVHNIHKLYTHILTEENTHGCAIHTAQLLCAELLPFSSANDQHQLFLSPGISHRAEIVRTYYRADTNQPALPTSSLSPIHPCVSISFHYP